jgi:hypothetical protein
VIFKQCFGSEMELNSIRSVHPDSDPGGQKGPIKIEKVEKFHVLKCLMDSYEG